MSDTFISDINNANNRMAISALRKNPANFKVFSFYISLGFIFGISVLAGSLVAIYNEDQEMSPNTLKILVFLNIATVVVLFLSYLTYIRNIGKYVYGRIKPIGDPSSKLEECKRNLDYRTSRSDEIAEGVGIRRPPGANPVTPGLGSAASSYR